jgi:hypothetical protein
LPLTVLGTLLSAQETRVETLKKMYSIKKVSFDVVVDVGDFNIFSTTLVPQNILQYQSNVFSGANIVVSSTGGAQTINATAMTYLTNVTERQSTYVNSTTVTIAALAAVNPVLYTTATKDEFDLYINGQYIDKAAYTWTPSDIISQTIVFDTNILNYNIDPTDVIIVKGRWA